MHAPSQLASVPNPSPFAFGVSVGSPLTGRRPLDWSWVTRPRPVLVYSCAGCAHPSRPWSISRCRKARQGRWAPLIASRSETDACAPPMPPPVHDSAAAPSLHLAHENAMTFLAHGTVPKCCCNGWIGSQPPLHICPLAIAAGRRCALPLVWFCFVFQCEQATCIC
jgi:hypothetical protein